MLLQVILHFKCNKHFAQFKTLPFNLAVLRRREKQDNLKNLSLLRYKDEKYLGKVTWNHV